MVAFLVVALGLSSASHAEDKPVKSIKKELSSIPNPTATTTFEIQRKPGPSAKPAESSPSGLPPIKTGTPVDKIPPKRIGDLECGQPQPGDNDWNACQDYCKSKPETPCAMLCTYRKNDEGECVLYVQCTNLCDEIPVEETDTSTGR